VNSRLIAMAVLLLAACSKPAASSDPLVNPTRSPALLATASPSPTPSPTPKPTPIPIDVTVTVAPKASQQGDTASVTIKTQSGASCKIDVQYPSGSSEAAGLGTKKASAAGVVTWKWLVGSQTTVGTWPIVIDCTTPGHAGEASTSITVK
jgi:hypothetical protein